MSLKLASSLEGACILGSESGPESGRESGDNEQRSGPSLSEDDLNERVECPSQRMQQSLCTKILDLIRDIVSNVRLGDGEQEETRSREVGRVGTFVRSLSRKVLVRQGGKISEEGGGSKTGPWNGPLQLRAERCDGCWRGDAQQERRRSRRSWSWMRLKKHQGRRRQFEP